MAFVRHIPHGFEAICTGDGVSVSALVGFDDDDDIVYSVSVCLSRNPTGELELSFCVVETHDGNMHYDIWDGRGTRYLKGADRRHVLNVVRGAVLECMTRLVPSMFTMVTYDGHLPDKALVKYRFIAHMSEKSGYRVLEFDSYQGKRLWVFERLETRA